MADSSTWARFAAITAGDPVLLAKIVTDHGDGTATVEDPSGDRWRVSGSGATDDPVWVQSGRIINSAPSMTIAPTQDV